MEGLIIIGHVMELKTLFRGQKGNGFEGKGGKSLTFRGGNRTSCLAGAYDLAYIKPGPSYTFHEINQV